MSSSAGLFPKCITLVSFTPSVVADAGAAVIGTAVGRHRLAGKTPGTLTFFITALLMACLAPRLFGGPTEYLIGAAAALAGAIGPVVWLLKNFF